MASDLLALRDIVVSSVDNIVAVCKETGQEFPSLDDPVHPSEFTPEGIRNNPRIFRSITLAVAAANQLIAALQPPTTSLSVATLMYNLPAALSTVELLNVPEIIRSTGAKGMHVQEICKVNGADPKKLAHILRFLATQHWFREVAPDTFASNMLSSLIDTGKELTEDFASTKHMGTSGLAALVQTFGDEGMKTGAYLAKNLTDPKTAHSEEPDEAAFQRGMGTTQTLWGYYYDVPENRAIGERFNAYMTSFNILQPPMGILKSFDWETIPSGHLLVDVGGNLGHVSMEVAKVHKNVHVAIEDHENVLSKSKAYWEENLPEYVSGGKVNFIEANFFDEQPALPGVPGVFLLRIIVHDWSDKYAIKILRRLRDAAAPTTKLVLISCITDYACRTPNDDETEVPPAPLLPNLGGANLFPYLFDLTMMGFFNAKERTLQGHIDILEAAGWKFAEVRRNPARKELLASIIAVPGDKESQ